MIVINRQYDRTESLERDEVMSAVTRLTDRIVRPIQLLADGGLEKTFKRVSPQIEGAGVTLGLQKDSRINPTHIEQALE